MVIKYNNNFIDNKTCVLNFLEKHKNKVLTKEEQIELATLCNIPNNTRRRVKTSIGVIANYISDNFKSYSVISKPIFYNDKPMNRRWSILYEES